MTVRFVSLSVVTVAESVDADFPAERHLAALAMLILEQTQIGWQVSLRSAAIGAGDGEAGLLARATEHLPDSGVAICWQLVRDNVSPLVAIARDADPRVTLAFLDRLKPLVAAPAVDLAVEHGGRAAPSLAEVAAVNGISLVSMTPDEIEIAWACGDTGKLNQHASARAVATMRLWLEEAPSGEFPAKAAFARWLTGDGDNVGAEDSQ